jgi:phosphoglucomutase
VINLGDRLCCKVPFVGENSFSESKIDTGDFKRISFSERTVESFRSHVDGIMTFSQLLNNMGIYLNAIREYSIDLTVDPLHKEPLGWKLWNEITRVCRA